MARSRITVAILALGGQGGGVLTDWITGLANANGYMAQATSVPGVAQRTGTTVYYIEMVPAGGAAPVLALSPVPGDVDIVVASELMEAGRAMLRGFVTERTTLIGSTHRVYAIAEKSALGSGIAASDRIVAAAERRAARFIGFDMDAAAKASGSVISAVMFGALAASGALPFATAQFEAAIRGGGKAVEANLRGFAAGAAGLVAQPVVAVLTPPPAPTTAAGRALLDRIETRLPDAAQALATEGVRRLMDYQDADYAALYLDRVECIASLGHTAVTGETARQLALWMSYEDIARVADLKTRASRFARVRDESGAGGDQLGAITEYMHPRLAEICDQLPAALGNAILARTALRRRLEPLFARGRHVETSSLGWFALLWLAAGLRRFRRGSLRYRDEQARIEAWLAAIIAASADPALALEIAAAQRLIKGYSDTAARGLASFNAVMAAVPHLAERPDAAARLRGLVDAALADEHGTALAAALDESAAA